jgi:hypothetical protein
MGRHVAEFVLQSEHAEVLLHKLRTGTTEYRFARRSHILLLRAEEVGPTEVAERLQIGRNMVWRIEERVQRREQGSDQSRKRAHATSPPSRARPLPDACPSGDRLKIMLPDLVPRIHRRDWSLGATVAPSLLRSRP